VVGDSFAAAMNTEPATPSSLGAARRAPAADSNQAFLRVMSDHHHALVTLIDSTMPRLGAAKVDADTLRQQQQRGRDDMIQMLSTEYDDPITPAPVQRVGGRPSTTGARVTGAAADRMFYQQTVEHQRDGVSTIDRYMPHLTGKQKTMAETMRAAHVRQIAAFERKKTGSR